MNAAGFARNLDSETNLPVGILVLFIVEGEEIGWGWLLTVVHALADGLEDLYVERGGAAVVPVVLYEFEFEFVGAVFAVCPARALLGGEGE